jgi:adenylyltransferase/sulfurtransferase
MRCWKRSPPWAQIAAHDLVLDCTDNVAIRNQLNAGCFRHKTPLVSGAAIRMEGQISVFTWQEVSRAVLSL